MKKVSKRLLFLVGFLVAALLIQAQQNATLTTPNPSAEAKALFRYLNDMYGKKILSGQMWASWGIDELKYIKEVTGKPTTAHIADRIISEAKALLQHTKWSINEIAYALGFEYPTYFNNFFKKKTGEIPKSVRSAHL